MEHRDDVRGNGKREARTGPTPKRHMLDSPKFWLGVVLVVLFAVFVAQNRTLVEVNYVFFSKKSYLIWVMLICGVLGFVVGWLWGRPRRADAKRPRKGQPDK